MKGGDKLGLKENIKYYRTECNMTLEEVAKHLGISKATVQRYESGVIKNIPPEKIKQLSEIFNVTPSDLYGWDEMYPDVAVEFEEFEEFVVYLRSLNYLVKTYQVSEESYEVEMKKNGINVSFTKEEF